MDRHISYQRHTHTHIHTESMSMPSMRKYTHTQTHPTFRSKKTLILRTLWFYTIMKHKVCSCTYIVWNLKLPKAHKNYEKKN